MQKEKKKRRRTFFSVDAVGRFPFSRSEKSHKSCGCTLAGLMVETEKDCERRYLTVLLRPLHNTAQARGAGKKAENKDLGSVLVVPSQPSPLAHH